MIQLAVDIFVSVLVVASGIFCLIGALGLLRLRDFFQRTHPPALAYTLGAWCLTLASIVYFSVLEARLAPHTWVIIILLSITAPVTTTLLARAGLFRKREEAQATPAPPPDGS